MITMPTKREQDLWEAHLAEQNKELYKGIIESRKGYSQREKGRIEVRGEENCIVCKKPGREILFLGRNNMGTSLCICKNCLKEALDLIEKGD